MLTLYSYRDDPAVPGFADAGPTAIMDAHCALCAHGARWIASNDSKEEFRIVPVQSPLGAALLRHYDMDPGDPASWLYLEEGKAYGSLDALIRVGARMGGIWQLLCILRLLPKSVRDGLYRLVARNRYRLFGRADLCSVPDEQVQRRLLT